MNRWGKTAKKGRVLERDNFTCLYCGEYFGPERGRELTLDHVIPRSRRKSDLDTINDLSNLVCACLRCNQEKGNQDVKVYASMPAQERIFAALTRQRNTTVAQHEHNLAMRERYAKARIDSTGL